MKRVIIVMFVAIMAGCTTTITTRMINQSLTNTIEKQKLMDTIGFVLMDNGFDIKMANESFGIINTEWRAIKSGADTALTVFSAFLDSSMTKYSRDLMMQINLTETGYKLSPKLRRKSKSSGFYGGSTEEIEYPTQESPEGKLAMKIVEEINDKLGIGNDYIWEEKVITIGEEDY